MNFEMGGVWTVPRNFTWAGIGEGPRSDQVVAVGDVGGFGDRRRFLRSEHRLDRGDRFQSFLDRLRERQLLTAVPGRLKPFRAKVGSRLGLSLFSRLPGNGLRISSEISYNPPAAPSRPATGTSTPVSAASAATYSNSCAVSHGSFESERRARLSPIQRRRLSLVAERMLREPEIGQRVHDAEVTRRGPELLQRVSEERSRTGIFADAVQSESEPLYGPWQPLLVPRSR